MSDETASELAHNDSDEVGGTPLDAGEPESLDGAKPDDTTVYRVMTVESVTFDLGDPSPHVHLMENEAPYRHLSVPIALVEAQALWAALNHATGRRPATHELTSAIIRQLQTDIIAVRIVRIENGIYYASLDLMTPRGREQFDCRTSDGFILALRQTVVAPILCAEEVLQNFYL